MTFSVLPAQLRAPPVSKLQRRLLSHTVRRPCQPDLKFHFVVAAEPRATWPRIVPDCRRWNSPRSELLELAAGCDVAAFALPVALLEF